MSKGPTAYAPGARKGNRTWIVRGTVSGKQREITTSIDGHSRADERRELAQWDEFCERVESSSAAERRANEPPTRETATVAHAIKKYLAEVRPEARTEGALLNALEDEVSGVLLKDIVPEDVRAAARRLRPDSTKSANRWAIVPLSAAMAHAHECGLGPALRVRKLKETAPQTVVSYPEWTAELAWRALESGNAELHALLMTFAIHGWRVGEMLMIRHEWIDYGRGTIRRWVSKSQEWMTCDVDPAIVKMWKALPARADGRLWGIGATSPESSRRHAVYPLVDALLRPGEPRWRPHQARRGFATAADEAGRTEAQIRAAGGWKSDAVKRYIRVGACAARETVEAVSKRARRK